MSNGKEKRNEDSKHIEEAGEWSEKRVESENQEKRGPIFEIVQ